MQRLTNIEKWFILRDGTAINFSNPLPRMVRLDVNAPQPVNLFYNSSDGEVTFLAHVQGRDVIEFRCDGEFGISADGGECWLYTIDGEDFSFSIPDAVTLTKITTRRARNPELELMRVMMEQNVNRRMEALANELEQSFRRREEAAAALATQPAPASADKSDTVKPEPSKAPADADKPAPNDDGGAKPKAAGG